MWINGLFVFVYVLVAYRGQKKVQIPWDWSHRRHWVAMWVLGIEPQSSGRAARLLILSDISLAPRQPILKNTKSFLHILNPSKSVSAFEQDAWSKSRILVALIISLWNYYWYSSCPKGANDNLSSLRCKCSLCAHSSSLSPTSSVCAHMHVACGLTSGEGWGLILRDRGCCFCTDAVGHSLMRYSTQVFRAKQKNRKRSWCKDSLWVGVWKKSRLLLLRHEYWWVQPLGFTGLCEPKHGGSFGAWNLGNDYLLCGDKSNLYLGHVLTNGPFNNIHLEFHI